MVPAEERRADVGGRADGQRRGGGRRRSRHHSCGAWRGFTRQHSAANLVTKSIGLANAEYKYLKPFGNSNGRGIVLPAASTLAAATQ